MDIGLPEWLDLKQIGGIAVLTLALIQYFKGNLPSKLIKPVTLMVGIGFAYLSDLYVGNAVVWVKVVINGLLAGIVSDVGYGFLSNKSGASPFSLASKTQINDTAEAKKPGP